MSSLRTSLPRNPSSGGPRAAARALAQGLATLMEGPAATSSGGNAPGGGARVDARPTPTRAEVRNDDRSHPPAGLGGPDAGTSIVVPRASAHASTCRCGRPVYFRQAECPACQTPLGYDPGERVLLPLEPVASAHPGAQATDDEDERPATARLWRSWGASETAPRFRRCATLDTAAACNWLVAERDAGAGPALLCRSCRLTRVLPDLTLENSAAWWLRIEQAKRRLVALLLALNLPVRSGVNEDPAHGLVFDLLRVVPGAPPLVSGHADGVITVDVEEADDAWRRQRRVMLGEPHRTLLGDLRHETGHYYWQRLVEPGRWLAPWRELFGDDRKDREAALKKYADSGPPADWSQRYVSAYASSHPLEDWAETWAYYLQLVDTLETARSHGLDGSGVELRHERWGPEVLAGSGDPRARDFLQLLNGWLELGSVLDEISRSMGVADSSHFVLPPPAVRKLHLVHRVVTHAHLQA